PSGLNRLLKKSRCGARSIGAATSSPPNPKQLILVLPFHCVEGDGGRNWQHKHHPATSHRLFSSPVRVKSATFRGRSECVGVARGWAPRFLAGALRPRRVPGGAGREFLGAAGVEGAHEPNILGAAGLEGVHAPNAFACSDPEGG